MKLTLLFIVIAILVIEGESWFFSRRQRTSSSTRPHDIRTGSGLTQLYNQRVTHVDHVRRPLGNNRREYGPISHSGVLVTTADGRRFLVHKGGGYGISSSTVVTDARHMSSRWRTVGGRPIHESTVADFVRAGGRDYSLLRDNCHNGRCRMMRLP